MTTTIGKSRSACADAGNRRPSLIEVWQRDHANEMHSALAEPRQRSRARHLAAVLKKRNVGARPGRGLAEVGAGAGVDRLGAVASGLERFQTTRVGAAAADERLA